MRLRRIITRLRTLMNRIRMVIPESVVRGFLLFMIALLSVMLYAHPHCQYDGADLLERAATTSHAVLDAAAHQISAEAAYLTHGFAISGGDAPPSSANNVPAASGDDQQHLDAQNEQPASAQVPPEQPPIDPSQQHSIGFGGGAADASDANANVESNGNNNNQLEPASADGQQQPQRREEEHAEVDAVTGSVSIAAAGAVDDRDHSAIGEEETEPRTIGLGHRVPPVRARSGFTLEPSRFKFYGQEGGGHNFPDKILFETFFETPEMVENGVFVEVGAYDGRYKSNTFFFEKHLNWTGVLIEPQADQLEKLVAREERLRPNSWLVAKAVADEELCQDGVLSFLGNGQTAGASAKFTEKRKEKDSKHWTSTEPRDVPCEPLGKLLREIGLSHVDVLSIDVSGAELSVLRSIEFDKVAVRVIVVQLDYATPDAVASRELLDHNGFCKAYKAGNNEYYVGSDAELRSSHCQGHTKHGS